MKLFSASILLFNLLRAEAGRDGFRGLKKDSKAGKSDDFSFYLSFDYDSKSGKGMSNSKSGKVSKAGKGTVGDLLNPDCDPINAQAFEDECHDYCVEFFNVCVNPNYFSSNMGFDECVEKCAQWPRTRSVVSKPPEKFYHTHTDTFHCRHFHLWEARLANDSPYNAAFHCSHAIDASDDFCVDIDIGGGTPWERMRDGQCTHHMYGYCTLSDEDTVADCMRNSIDDDHLKYALQMLPPTVEVLFLNENEGITMLESGIFNNMTNPSGLKALYMDDCNITTIDEDVFHPLKNLEILALNFNKFSVIQDDLLKLPELKSFSVAGDPFTFPAAGEFGGRKPGQIANGGFTNKIFQHTPKLERYIMYGHSGLSELPAGMFNGLSKMISFYLEFNALNNAGIPDGLFEPLTSLKYFNLQGNQFTELDPDWFGLWSSNVERILFWFQSDLAPITNKTTFSSMPKLKTVHLYNNPRLNVLTSDFFKNNPDLEILTI